MQLFASTKANIKKLREDKGDSILNEAKSFCQHHIDISNFGAPCTTRRSQGQGQPEKFTFQNIYRVEIFFVTVDKQLQELNHKFSEEAIEFLTLSSSLVPKNSYKAFNIEDICRFVKAQYPRDFIGQERINLKFQL